MDIESLVKIFHAQSNVDWPLRDLFLWGWDTFMLLCLAGNDVYPFTPSTTLPYQLIADDTFRCYTMWHR